MARPKSDLLSNMGSWFEILKALADGVLSRGGSDAHLRRIKTPWRLKRIIDILMLPPKPEGNQLDGMIPFTVVVNYDDPMLASIDSRRYSTCSIVRHKLVANPPELTGIRRVNCVWIPTAYFDGDEVYNRDLERIVAQVGVQWPDRAVAEYVLRDHTMQTKIDRTKVRIAFCGPRYTATDGQTIRRPELTLNGEDKLVLAATDLSGSTGWQLDRVSAFLAVVSIDDPEPESESD